MAISTQPRLCRLRLKSEDCAPGEAFARWRDALGEVFEVRAAPEEISQFRGEIDVRASPHYVFSASRHSPLSFVHSSGNGGQDRFAIWLQVYGSITGLAGDGETQAEPGDVIFVDLLRPLSIRQSATEGFVEALTLWTSHGRLLPLVAHENALHGLVVKGASAQGAVIGASMRAFAVQAAHMSQAEFDALADGLVSLAAKSIAPVLMRASELDAAPPLASLIAIRRYIDRNVATPDLCADSIASAFGLSRASLYRLFESAGGIATYIRKTRLTRAFQEITAAEFFNRRIGHIAHTLGFKNVSAFSRLFHEVYGMTPGEARERARQTVAKAEYAVPAQPGESLTSWLQALSG